MAKLLGHDICTRDEFKEFTQFAESRHDALHDNVDSLKAQLVTQSDSIAELKSRIEFQSKLFCILAGAVFILGIGVALIAGR
jgi:hypothetical protein